MKEYILLLKIGELEGRFQEERESRAYQEDWEVYMQKLNQLGALKGGFPLLPEGRVLTKNNCFQASFANEGGIEGYLIVEAEDYEESVLLSKDCPVLQYGGSIEIREIMSYQ